MYDGEKVTILDVFESSEVLDDIVSLCEDPKVCKVFHNAKFDLSFVRAHAKRRVRYSNIWDTMLAEQVLMAGWSYPYYDKKDGEIKKRLPGFALADLVSRHLGFKLDKDMQKSNWGSKELTEEQLKYAAKDVEVLLPIYEIQRELLEVNNLINTATMEFNTLAPIIEIEFYGMPVNWVKAEELRAAKKIELAESKKDLEKEVRSSQKSTQMSLLGLYAGIDINLNSPVQVTKYLKDKLGYDVDSSDVETLKSIDHPFAAKLLRFRTLEKHLNFIDQFESFGAKTGRLYPTYNQCRAATGRMSSSKPNGQQIPKRGDGKIFRSLFKTQPGYKLVKIDFAAIEMRVIARLAKDKAMMDAIANGVDLHRLTAAKTANKTMEEITKEDRQKAKAVNFGLIYGMSAPTLKKYAFMNYNVRMTDEEALQTRDRYFDLYRGIAGWHIEQKEAMHTPRPYHCHSHDKGFHIMYVAMQQTLTGRKRFWSNFAGETIAKPTEFYNSADQGTSADITKLSLIELYKILPEDAHIIAAIHDEVLVEVPEEKAQDVAKLLVDTLCRVGSDVLHPVKVDAEVEIHDSWGE
jgi:DNA polymerase I-like protein with 3'-5' exonuclease and polymerase domains